VANRVTYDSVNSKRKAVIEYADGWHTVRFYDAERLVKVRMYNSLTNATIECTAWCEPETETNN